MTSIRDRIEAILTPAADRYAEGYEAGVSDTLTALSDFVSEQTWRADRPTRRDAPQPQPAPATNGSAPPRRRRQGLTPSEARVLDFVAANPGCTMADIRATGIIPYPGTVYSLVAHRDLGLAVAHPMEPRNG